METHRFNIQFHPPGSAAFLERPNGIHKWVGTGLVLVADGQLTIAGYRHRLLRARAAQTLTLELAAVVNVYREQAQVSLSIVNTDNKLEAIQFWVDSESSAIQLVSLLPTTRTTEFAQQLDDVQEFAQQLEALPERLHLTEILIAANVLMFAISLFASSSLFAANDQVLIHYGSNFGLRTLHGEWWRLFTANFLHLHVLHLAMNMWLLYSFGQLTERLFGATAFLLLYLFAGMTGSMTSIWWNPQVHSVGASGAVFGVFGALLACILNPRVGVPASVMRAQLKSLSGLLAFNLFYGLTHRGIDNAAHVGGLLGGFVIGWVISRPLHSDAPEASFKHVPTHIAFIVAGLGLLAWIRYVGQGAWSAEERAFITAARVAMNTDSRMEQRADGLAASARLKTLPETQAADLMIKDVSATLRQQLDLIEAVPLAEDSALAPMKSVLLDYLDSRRLGTELLGEASQFKDADKYQWALQVLQKGNPKRDLLLQQLAALSE